MKWLIVYSSFACLLLAPSFADEITLTTGRVINGRILSIGTDGAIQIEVSGSKDPISIPKSDVKKFSLDDNSRSSNLAITQTSPAEAPNFPVIQQPFAGVYLGENLRTLAQRCDPAGPPSRLDITPLPDGVFDSYGWMFGSPSGNKDVAITSFKFVRDCVAQITLRFLAGKGGDRAWRAINDKYGTSESNDASYKKTVTIDGEEVVITAKWELHDVEPEPELSLTYGYKKLIGIAESKQKQAETAIQQKKEAEDAERAQRSKTDY